MGEKNRRRIYVRPTRPISPLLSFHQSLSGGIGKSGRYSRYTRVFNLVDINVLRKPKPLKTTQRSCTYVLCSNTVQYSTVQYSTHKEASRLQYKRERYTSNRIQADREFPVDIYGKRHVLLVRQNHSVNRQGHTYMHGADEIQLQQEAETG